MWTIQKNPLFWFVLFGLSIWQYSGLLLAQCLGGTPRSTQGNIHVWESNPGLLCAEQGFIPLSPLSNTVVLTSAYALSNSEVPWQAEGIGCAKIEKLSIYSSLPFCAAQFPQGSALKCIPTALPPALMKQNWVGLLGDWSNKVKHYQQPLHHSSQGIFVPVYWTRECQSFIHSFTPSFIL